MNTIESRNPARFIEDGQEYIDAIRNTRTALLRINEAKAHLFFAACAQEEILQTLINKRLLEDTSKVTEHVHMAVQCCAGCIVRNVEMSHGIGAKP